MGTGIMWLAFLLTPTNPSLGISVLWVWLLATWVIGQEIIMYTEKVRS